MSSVGASNASDIGLIVQGTLIFLSALVAVAGYVVQSHIRAREQRRQLDLDHKDFLRKQRLELLRNKLRTFIGPANGLMNALWNAVWKLCFNAKSLASMGPAEDGVAPAVNFNTLAGGDDRVYKFWTRPREDGGLGFSFFPGMLKGQWNAITSFVGPEVEEEMRRAPGAALATYYRRQCRRIVKHFAAPLKDLIVAHGMTLDMRPTLDAFKAKYPVVAPAAWARNMLYLDLVEWTTLFQDIFEQWDRENFSEWFPRETPLPGLLVKYISDQCSDLKNLEDELGSAQHTVFDESKEVERVRASAAEGNKTPRQKSAASPNAGPDRAPSSPSSSSPRTASSAYAHSSSSSKSSSK